MATKPKVSAASGNSTGNNAGNNAGNGSLAANDKSGGPIKVVMPDANGNFDTAITRGAVEKVQIVDVDMVLQLKDGTSVVLAGGAINAMDADKSTVHFSDGTADLSKFMDQVGVIGLQKIEQPLVLSTLTPPPEHAGHGDNTSPTDAQATSNNASASVTSQVVNQLTQIIQSNTQSVTQKPTTEQSTVMAQAVSAVTHAGHAEDTPITRTDPPQLLERRGLPVVPTTPAKDDTPPETPVTPVTPVTPDTPTTPDTPSTPDKPTTPVTPVTPSEPTKPTTHDKPSMTISLLNLTDITQDGSTLYGSGGAPSSAVDPSNGAQFAAQVINAPASATTIYATGHMPADHFIKVLEVKLTGGDVSNFTISGVPSDVTILNAHLLANGDYSVSTVAGQSTYDLQLQYATVLTDPLAPNHEQFSLTISTTIGDDAVVLAQTKQFIVRDVSKVEDLSYVDATTGNSLLVLPGQGVNHIVHAGDSGVTIYGSNANDQLYGGAGADIIHAGSGDTYMEGGAGADQLIGGVGNNTAGYKSSATGVTVDLNGGTGSGGDATGDTLVNINNVVGSAHDDVFISSSAANTIDGGSGGSDTVSYALSDKAVTVDLGTGAASGGYADGDKLIHIQNVIGSKYADTFVAGNDPNAFDGGPDVGPGNNTVSYANSTAGVTVDLSNTTGAGTSGGFADNDKFTNIQNVVGTAYDDVFVASADANFFDGGRGGNDTVSYAASTAGVTVNFGAGRGLHGFAEGDSYKAIQNVIGSAYDDTFMAGYDSKNFDGGSGGHDAVSYAYSDGAVTIDTWLNKGSGGYADNNTYVSIEKFIGTSYSDTFIGNGDANDFDGGVGGSDTVSYIKSTAGVTVDLFNGVGTAGDAAGDKYTHISNAIGGTGDDLFIASVDQNAFDGGPDSGAHNNTVSYANSTAGVTVDLSQLLGAGTFGGFALGDSFVNIQNLIGSQNNDVFVASSDANHFEGGGGDHDRVSYAASTAAVTINLRTGIGSGGYAAGDTLSNIQDLTGSAYDDKFIANSAHNNFDGGAGSDTVSYEGGTVGVTVDLVAGTGTGGDADGDTYANIENVIGGSGDDLFYANALANSFDGGAGTNTVSYAKADDGAGVTVNLFTGAGTHGYAAGDTYQNIQNVIGTNYADTFIDGSGVVPNTYTGLGSSDTISYENSDAGVTVNLITNRGSGGFAQGDIYIGIENVRGSSFDDIFIAAPSTTTFSSAFDGGVSDVNSHNLVDFSQVGVAVTVDLSNTDGTNTAGGAHGDTFVNIQDLKGTSLDDTFIASAAANNLDGGTGSLHNRVSYASSNTGVIVDLNHTDGTGTSGGYAAGDHLVNIQDLTGSAYDDTFVASAAANNFDGGVSDANSHNRVSYAQSTTGVTVDLSNSVGAGTSGGAAGDTFVNIQDLTGSAFDDTFVATAAANNFDGGVSDANSHNRVSYARSTAGVTVDLRYPDGTGTSGGYAAGDTLVNIQDLTGSNFDDLFIASDAANHFDGGVSDPTSHNKVSYTYAATGITVDLAHGSAGLGGAAGDTFANIQDIDGTTQDDTIIASAAANYIDGGASTASSHNRVSYVYSNAGVTVDLNHADGTGTSGGYADGDHLSNIQDLTGSSYDDTFIATAAANNFDGGASTSTSHNRVSYAASNAAVTVDLNYPDGTGTSGGYAAGDTLVNIQDLTGSSYDDLFIASNVANHFDGGVSTATSHNTVSYATATSAISVDLANLTLGIGGAAGDTFVNIQDLIGTSYDDTFIASAAANYIDGGVSTATSHNRVSYAASDAAVIVDLNYTNGTGTSGGYAAGDKLTNIQDLTGSSFDDLFIASAAGNAFDGGSSTATSHNRVSYAASNAGVIVDLSNTTGAGTSGGYAQGDSFVNIQDITGTTYNDTFVASAAANNFDGVDNTATSHNRVSYANDTAGVTVNLNYTNGTGTAGGYAAGDTLANIQDLTGGTGNDTFVASLAANYFDGGTSTASSHNRVDYSASNAAVIVDLNYTDGSGTSGGYAAGDHFINIQDLTGSSYDDTFIATAAANYFDGGVSTAASHNRVSYVNDTAGVTVNLNNTDGTGTSSGYAAGDRLINIQDLTGGSGNDTFVASLAANNFDGGTSTATSHNRVSYASSAAGVIIDLNYTNGTGTSGGYAAGDTLTNIQDLTGSSSDDTFIASLAANYFDGGTSTATSHNRVSYASSAAGVIVDLNYTNGTGTSGGYAAGDTLTNIQDLTGSSSDDTFVASLAANYFDGGTSTATSHNRVSYVNDTAGVTVNLNNTDGTGTSGGYAAGDHLINIQDLTGGSGNDTFIASAAANNFDGGTSTATSHNRVSYASSTAGVIVDLNYTNGTGTSGGYAAGDTLTNIQDLTGSSSDDTFIASLAANYFDGGTSTATSHNRVSYVNDTAGIIVDLNYTNGTGTSVGYAAGDHLINIQDLTGGSGNDTFIASAAANYFDGGTSTAASHNVVSYASSTAAVTVDLSNTTGANTSGGYAAGDTFINIQDLIGSAYADFLTGAAGGGSTLTGLGGADHLTGLGLNNTASYTASAAAVMVDLTGGVSSGGDAAGDVLTNIQNVVGSANADTFYASLQANKFTGGGGIDTVSYEKAANGIGVVANLSTGLGSGAGSFAENDSYNGITNLIGTTYNDTLTGLATGGSTLTGGQGADTLIGIGLNNTASYAPSTTSVTVDLAGYNGTGTQGDALGDVLTNIQNLLGGNGDDKFILSGDANVNIANGGGGTNTISYEHETVGMTINLFNNTAFRTAVPLGTDTITNFQNAIGGSGDDLFVASSVSNVFTGGLGSDTVSYVNSTAAVKVDFHSQSGTLGYAAGDSYNGIENVIGTAYSDTFVSNGTDGIANRYDGGSGGSDTVDYSYATASLNVNLATPASNTADALGDTYNHISNLIGSLTANTTLTGDGTANVLTAQGSSNTNFLYGGGAAAGTTDILDGRAGGHNSMYAGDTGNTYFEVLGSSLAAGGNLTLAQGSAVAIGAGGTETLKVFSPGASLVASDFSSKVSNINLIDIADTSVVTNISIGSADILHMNSTGTLNINLNATDSISLLTTGTQTSAVFGNGDYVFYTDSSHITEVARLHVTLV